MASLQPSPEREPLVLAGDAPLVLTDSPPAWHVKSGELALFAVEKQNETTGSRQFLFNARGGDILFAARSDLERMLIALPAGPATLVPLTLLDLTANGRYLHAIEAWCANVGRLLQVSSVPAEAKPIPAGDTTVAAIALNWTTPEPGWIRLVSGSASVAGLGAEIPIGSPVPMAPGIWLAGPAPFEAQRITRTTAARELRLEAIQKLADTLLRAAPKIGSQRDAENRRLLERRQRSESRIGNAALAALFGGSPQIMALSEAPLLAAARLVAEAVGLELRAPADPSPREHPVAAIAAASGWRARRVLLTGDWWRRDNGPLLAYRLADQSPVALIPARLRSGGIRYEMVDPGDGSTTSVAADSAASLDTKAFSFYRQFGLRPALLDLIWFGLRPYKADLAMVIFSSAAATLLGMAVPAANSVLFGQAIPDVDRSLLWQVIFGLVVTFLAATLFNLAQSISMVRIQSGMSAALQCGIWDRLLQLSPAFFRKFSVGDLWLRVDAVERIRRQFTLGAITAMFTGVTSVFQIGLMLYYSPALTGIACAAGFVILLATVLATRKLYELERVRQSTEGFLSGLVVQLVNSVGKLRIAGAERRAFAKWGISYGYKQRIALQVRGIRDRIHILNAMVPSVATALTLAWIARGDGVTLPVGTYLAFAASFATFLSGIVNLSETIAGLTVATIWNRAKPILEEEREVSSTNAHPGRLTGSIRVEHVDFRYRDSGPLTLQDISFEVRPGECVALVGASGSGKSTLLNLLLRFELPSSGAVYLDGQNLSTLDISAVRRQFGVVNQDSRLISQSIFENIVCGALCTLNEAWDAARAAAVAEDIEDMPMGMHTFVSEGGTNLSGGQRQRILIARALVQKPAVLILDEATSALDNRTQRSVTESLRSLQTTRIVVAHRLSTVRHADRIYVLDGGRFVQHGTYEELVATPGPFFELMKNQLSR